MSLKCLENESSRIVIAAMEVAEDVVLRFSNSYRKKNSFFRNLEGKKIKI